MEIHEIRRAGFLWLDITNPLIGDLQKIGTEYKLDLSTINDCLEPEHLPKYEIIDNTTFIILRAYDAESNKKSDKVQTITNKVAMFFSNDFLITIHRSEQLFIREMFDKMNAADMQDKTYSTFLVANEIMMKVARTYEHGIHSVYQAFEAFEQEVFNKHKKAKMLQSYLLKRRIDIVHRVLTLMKDPIYGLMNSAQGKTRLEFKNTKEYVDKLIYQVDVVHDNLVALLNLQLSMASQVTNEATHKTNEVMRVLTIFSVFFMPINFIASVYGMNFEHIPLLKEESGFWITLGLMMFVTLWIFIWFSKKGFMSSRDS
jgi:magnesium transporter